MTARARGTGSLRLRGKTWWIRFSVDGKRLQETSNSEKRSVAVKMLNERLGQIATGNYRGPVSDRLNFSDLEKMLGDHYHAMRSRDRAERALVHLRRHLGLYRIKNLKSDVLTGYVTARREEGASEATIKYELAILKKGFSLALRAEKISHRPAFPVLKIENTRTGFFEEEEFAAVLEELPEYLKGVMTFAYLTGWRVMSEVVTLEWSQVNFKAGVVRLEPGTTKNGQGRTFPFNAYPKLKAVLEDQQRYSKRIARTTGKLVPWVFHRDGHQIKNFREAWRLTCVRAGLAKPKTDAEGRPVMDKKGKPVMLAAKIPHDFRRTAVRNLERAGVSRSVAMKLVGHQTESIYQRYAIVAESDLEEGVAKLAGLEKPKRKHLRFKTGS